MSGKRPRWWQHPLTHDAVGLARQFLVVTDIDASLLESNTRGLPDERAAIDFLAARGIPLVITSSRTRAEIERLQKTLQMLTPFISENGSALFMPHGCFPFVPLRARSAIGGHVVEFGRRYHEVVDALRQTSHELGVEIVGFAELTIDDVARELGVTSMDAQLAKLREYSELFRFVDEAEATRSRLFKALRRRGLRSRQTGRHHLVTATRDRTESLRMLKTMWKAAWGETVVIGFGDSEDDVAWLQHVDVPIVVHHDGVGVPPRVLAKLPTVHIARSPGRRGWSEAVFELVGGLFRDKHRAPID